MPIYRVKPFTLCIVAAATEALGTAIASYFQLKRRLGSGTLAAQSTD